MPTPLTVGASLRSLRHTAATPEMSTSDTKADFELTPPIRNRMIPRFLQRPDRAAGSFVSDVDTERPHLGF